MSTPITMQQCKGQKELGRGWISQEGQELEHDSDSQCCLDSMPRLCPPLLDLSVQSSPTKREFQGDLSSDLKEKQDCSRWRRGHSRLRQLCGYHGGDPRAFAVGGDLE